MASFDQFISSIRHEFGEQDAGKKFEVFCKWFLENDPEWSKKVDRVWLWDEYPSKWQRQDLGTDLVFKDNDGLIWAVQAKCYSEHRTTTKGDMNSFLADTGRPEVDRRLWLQTTNKIEAKAEKTYKGQDKHVTIITLNYFRDAQIDYPSSFSDLYQAKVKAKPKPDPHQVKAIEDVTVGLQKSDRGQMIMACGTGKTFTTLWIKEALKSETTLVLLPSLSLLSQTMREWAWAGNTDFEILNVCSDKSVGKKTEDMAPSDAPFAVTSDVQEISKFLRKSGPRVVFCTYQSSQLIAEAQIDTKVPTFDLAIADEAHRCAGKADAGFATILDGEKIRASKRLFTTATPRYFGKAIKDASKAADLAVIGMDDETVFGPVIHQLTFGQAIQHELLNDYQVVIVGVDEPMVKQWIDNYEIVATNPDETTDARTLAAKIGMLKAVKDYDLKRVISFHSRVSGAKKFSEELIEVADLIEPANRPDGTFLSDYVSGEMKAGDRKDKIDKLKELEGYDRGILTNARCLAEGVDVPSLDGVAFIDPKGSQVEIIQAVGRAIRKVRGAKIQTKGTIVIPVFIEDGDNHEASIEASNFKPVWDVLKALRAHDEVLADVLDTYRTNMAKNSSQARENISDKIVFDLPMSVDAEFSSALRTVLVEASTASWEFWFGLLIVYKSKHGDCLVRSTDEENIKLNRWLNHQRYFRRNNLLIVEREDKLNDLGVVWDVKSDMFMQKFDAYSNYLKISEDKYLPSSLMYEGHNIGKWATTCRYEFNTKTIISYKVKLLNEVGFIWDNDEYRWQKIYNFLKDKFEADGNIQLPDSYVWNGWDISDWMSRQRAKKNELIEERIKLLDELNFSWDPKRDAWEFGYNIYKSYISCFKIKDLNTKTIFDGYNLGHWISLNRRNYKSGRTEDYQIEKLNKLNFDWDPLETVWFQSYEILIDYGKDFSFDTLSQSTEHKGEKIGIWAYQQLRRYNNGTLEEHRIKLLKKIQFIS